MTVPNKHTAEEKSTKLINVKGNISDRQLSQIKYTVWKKKKRTELLIRDCRVLKD